MPLSGVMNYPDGVLPGLSSHLHVFSVLQLLPRGESGQNLLPPVPFTVLPKGVWKKEAKELSQYRFHRCFKPYLTIPVMHT